VILPRPAPHFLSTKGGEAKTACPSREKTTVVELGIRRCGAPHSNSSADFAAVVAFDCAVPSN
jgi:hypothetical protein